MLSQRVINPSFIKKKLYLDLFSFLKTIIVFHLKSYIVFHYVNVPQLFLIQPSTDRHLGYFQIVAMVNNTATNKGAHTFFLIGFVGF